MDRLEKIDAILLEMTVRQAERDAQQSKTDAQLAKTDAQLAKTDAQLAKTDAQLAKTDAQLAKASADWMETKQVLSNIGVNLGLVAEEFFYNSLKDKMKFGNIKFDFIKPNVSARNKKAEDEFDIVMYNGDSIALIEIKHKVHPKDIIKLKTSKIVNFKTLFPDYADYKVYLGIGGFSVPADIEALAKESGVAVLRQKGEIAEILDKNLVAY